MKRVGVIEAGNFAKGGPSVILALSLGLAGLSLQLTIAWISEPWVRKSWIECYECGGGFLINIIKFEAGS